MGIIRGSKADKWLKDESSSLTLKEKLRILRQQTDEQKRKKG